MGAFADSLLEKECTNGLILYSAVDYGFFLNYEQLSMAVRHRPGETTLYSFYIFSYILFRCS